MQRSGYPDLRLVDKESSRVFYLDPKLYGASVNPHREEAKDYRRLFDGPLDGAGRRSIYLKVTRMEGARFLETFDFPPPLTTRGARDTTNVPAQALAMLNDPFVTQQAEFWAAKLIERRDDTLESRIQFMHLAALGRPADEQELANFAALARQIADLRKSPDRLADSAVWKDLAHAKFNLKEFLYIR